MIVAEAVGRVLAAAGAEVVFGVVGSGNFHVTNALVRHGARFVAARHEGGAATMADAYARMSGKLAVVSVHQGPGFTNAITGIAEAAKSRTPMIVLAGEATDARSNFAMDQDAVARAVGAVPLRVSCPDTAGQDTLEAFRVATEERRTVLLNLPLDVQAADAGESWERPAHAAGRLRDRPSPAPQDALPEEVAALGRLLVGSRRPVFVAGRGARRARRELEELAEPVGALLATSAVARGLFRGSPWDLDVSGGFATPLAAELIRGADLVVGWGCGLNMWTTRHGSLIGPEAKVIQVDLERESVGRHVPADLGVVGDVAWVARKVREVIESSRPREVRAASAPVGEDLGASPMGEGRGSVGPERGYRSAAVAGRIREEGRWRAVPYTDEGGDGRIDPRTLTIGLDDLLPQERLVSTDSGNFMGYPAMLLDVPDEVGFCFTQAFQAVGLGLATAIDAVTVTEPADLAGVAGWLTGPRDRPLLVHAKVTRERPSWWLEEAFRGH